MKKFKWICECSDGGYYEECNKDFETEKECYDDMRDAALKKMKWNTEYDEDFEDRETIGYQVFFAPNIITHKSYSGTYTYRIIDTDKKKYRVEMPFHGTMVYEVEAYTKVRAVEKANELLFHENHKIIADNAMFGNAEIYEL
jgi:hypothetical protein